jgi:maltose alpha-D-glucosyltransferase/alpha-amylase
MKTKENVFTSKKSWKQVFEDEEWKMTLLNDILPSYLKKCRWFGGKAKKIKQLLVQNLLVFPVGDTQTYFLILEAVYVGAYSENYFLPLFLISESEEIDKKALITSTEIGGFQGNLVDALYVESCRKALFEHIIQQKKVYVSDGTLVFERGSVVNKASREEPITSILLKADQSNTSVIYNDRFFLKIYRNLFRENNPDYEITKFLTEEADFANSPRYAGSITWTRPEIPNISIGLMQEKVANEGDAWVYFKAKVGDFFSKIVEKPSLTKSLQKVALYKPLDIRDLEPELVDLIGYESLKSVKMLAQRTAEMHIAISSHRSNYTFLPITFNEDYVVWLKNRLIYQFDRRLDLIEKTIDALDGLSREYAETFLERKEDIINTILSFDESKLISKRIRIHGDYHLGQVLKQGDDFIILDFEGEPESTIRDRKVKQPPIKDVAGMIRSFHYAIYANIFEIEKEHPKLRNELFEAGSVYYRATVAVFLNTYLNIAMKNNLSIGYAEEVNYLLRYHLLEKAIYELGYELNSRPDWAIIPLRGIMNLLEN